MENNKVPTAEEFFSAEIDIFLTFGSAQEQYTIIEGLIEFAKLHVKLALEAAATSAKPYQVDYVRWEVDADSILDAYPETLIK